MANILVADDSITIQKVVGITLANSGHNLIECLSEKELLNHVTKGSVDLILLDFNLSDSKTGYGLASEIKKTSPNVAILAMLGTFDTVDENALVDCGIGAKVVKPFESETFIRLVNELLEGTDDDEYEYVDDDEDMDEEVEDVDTSDDSLSMELDSSDMDLDDDSMEVSLTEDLDSSGLDDLEDDSSWVVEGPSLDDDDDSDLGDLLEMDSAMGSPMLSEVSDDLGESEKEQLADELKGWGMEVPGVIGSGSSEMEVPPRIGGQQNRTSDDSFISVDLGSKSELSLADSDATGAFSVDEILNQGDNGRVTDDGSILPADEDLDYPDLGSDIAIESSPGSSGLMSKMVSLDELALDDEETADDKTDPHYQAPNVSDLQKEIEADEDDNDFWAVDEQVEDLPVDEPAVSEPISMEPIELERPAPAAVSQPAPAASPAAAVINEDEIAARIMSKLDGMIQKAVEQYCQDRVDKVAWEVIPDLAENMIRSELKSIAKSVSSENNQ